MQRSREPADTKSVLCRYFMNGVCKTGSDCKFSHDIKDKPSMVCKYYLQGLCSYGSSCRYDHVKAKTKSAPTCPQPVIINTHDLNKQECKMVNLTKLKSKANTNIPSNWADAPEFVPGQAYKGLDRTDSDIEPGLENTCDEGAVGPCLTYSEATSEGIVVLDNLDDDEASNMLCPFAAMGRCEFDKCPYIHGLECDMCGRLCLHPFNEDQQKEHRAGCLERHEQDMEHSFAVQRSEGVSCGICLEVVKSKPELTQQRFGILPCCNHAFCLDCIRKWRNCSHTMNKIVRACPLCRVSSGFVIPSAVWVEDLEEKKKLIEEYTSALSAKPCKYFDEGRGTCPFGSSCFYRHMYPDGTKDEVRVRRLNTADGDVKFAKNCRIWDFMEAEENRRIGADENVLWRNDDG